MSFRDFGILNKISKSEHAKKKKKKDQEIHRNQEIQKLI